MEYGLGSVVSKSRPDARQGPCARGAAIKLGVVSEEERRNKNGDARNRQSPAPRQRAGAAGLCIWPSDQPRFRHRLAGGDGRRPRRHHSAVAHPTRHGSVVWRGGDPCRDGLVGTLPAPNPAARRMAAVADHPRLADSVATGRPRDRHARAAQFCRVPRRLHHRVDRFLGLGAGLRGASSGRADCRLAACLSGDSWLAAAQAVVRGAPDRGVHHRPVMAGIGTRRICRRRDAGAPPRRRKRLGRTPDRRGWRRARPDRLGGGQNPRRDSDLSRALRTGLHCPRGAYFGAGALEFSAALLWRPAGTRNPPRDERARDPARGGNRPSVGMRRPRPVLDLPGARRSRRRLAGWRRRKRTRPRCWRGSRRRRQCGSRVNCGRRTTSRSRPCFPSPRPPPTPINAPPAR